MTKGGLAAVQELIAARFKKLHGDCRDREQVQADLQLRTSLAGEMAAEVEKSSLLKTETEYGEREQRAFRIRAKCLSSAALRSGHVHSYRTLRRDLHHCYVAEAPTESASELFAQALRQLEVK